MNKLENPEKNLLCITEFKKDWAAHRLYLMYGLTISHTDNIRQGSYTICKRKFQNFFKISRFRNLHVSAQKFPI